MLFYAIMKTVEMTKQTFKTKGKLTIWNVINRKKVLAGEKVISSHKLHFSRSYLKLRQKA